MIVTSMMENFRKGLKPSTKKQNKHPSIRRKSCTNDNQTGTYPNVSFKIILGNIETIKIIISVNTNLLFKYLPPLDLKFHFSSLHINFFLVFRFIQQQLFQI